MVLIGSKLTDILVALSLSRATYRRIQWNFIWAMGYNVLMIPLAAGVLFPVMHVAFPPVLAGLAMVFYDIVEFSSFLYVLDGFVLTLLSSFAGIIFSFGGNKLFAIEDVESS